MPAPLKEALVRETARRGSNVNDVAAGIIADSFGIELLKSRRLGRSPRQIARTNELLNPKPVVDRKFLVHPEKNRF
jgi:hypothetical protein